MPDGTSYLVKQIKTRTSRGQSSAISERGNNGVAKTGRSSSTDNSAVTEKQTSRNGARRTVRRTTDSSGATTTSGGSTATTQTEHESFQVAFTIKVKGALVDPDVTQSPPPLTPPGPGPGI